ncbi:hypothetical protein, partial [Escherichia coli]|uniref:hypothetical protein n=1 Tax=Escherichia coli TaxID=562 RepID=UPI00201EB65D
HPQRQRLKMLGDRNSNCLNLYYDELGRITQISGEQQRPCIRLHYELAAHPRRVTQIYQHFPETAPLLLRREAVLPGSGFYSPGEGLAVRRGEQGHWLISSDDGQFFLF